MYLIKVRYLDSSDLPMGREYTYFSEAPVVVDQKLVVPVRDSIGAAQVTAIDVPEAEIAAFRDKVKTIRKSLEWPEPENAIEPDTVDANIEPQPTQELAQIEANTRPSPSTVHSENPTVLQFGQQLIHLTALPEYRNLASSAMQLLAYAQGRSVRTDADARAATDDLVMIAATLKRLEVLQIQYLRPLRDTITALNAEFGAVKAPLTEATRLDKIGIQEYQMAVKKRADDLADIETERLKLAHMEAAVNDGAHTQDLAPIAKPIVPERFSTYVGTTGTAKVRKFVITDFGSVPDEWKMLDTTKVGRAVRGGIGAIPGIRIYLEETLRVTSR